jgi:hypothetical protein
MQTRADREALATAMEDPSLGIDNADVHAQLRGLRHALSALEATLQSDVDAADSLRARVLEVVTGAEETNRMLRVNAARREVAAAQVRALGCQLRGLHAVSSTPLCSSDCCFPANGHSRHVPQ